MTTAWDYPFIIVLTGAVAILVVMGWLRLASPKRRAPVFECDVCGRKQGGLAPREWHFCPYCGTPHKRQRRSIEVSSWPGRFELPPERPVRRR